MREIITLQVGQCGNQIGHNFWSKICSEHNLDQCGYQTSNTDLEDRKDIFFYQADDGKFIPRTLLVDLEPRVINSLQKNFYNEENIFVSNEGCGAGNNWAHGYYSGKSLKNDIMDAIQREAEACDLLESFFMTHSVAGGTGSGFGSLLLEEIKQNFPKKILNTFSIFPNNEEISDVVVQPYNSVLALQRLFSYCDSVVVMDNGALSKIALDALRVKIPDFDQINYLVSTVMSTSTSTLRFPTYMFSDFTSILSATVPFNSLKFLIPSFSPFTNKEVKIVRKLTVDEIIRRIYSEKTKMANFLQSKTHSYVTALNIFNNVEDVSEVQKGLLKNVLDFVPWMPPMPHTVIGRNFGERVSGLCLANFTGISNLFKKIALQFDTLKKRNAYTENYKKFCGDLSVFDEAKESVERLIEEYQASELMSFKNK